MIPVYRRVKPCFAADCPINFKNQTTTLDGHGLKFENVGLTFVLCIISELSFTKHCRLRVCQSALEPNVLTYEIPHSKALGEFFGSFEARLLGFVL